MSHVVPAPPFSTESMHVNVVRCDPRWPLTILLEVKSMRCTQLSTMLSLCSNILSTLAHASQLRSQTDS